MQERREVSGKFLAPSRELLFLIMMLSEDKYPKLGQAQRGPGWLNPKLILLLLIAP